MVTRMELEALLTTAGGSRGSASWMNAGVRVSARALAMALQLHACARASGRVVVGYHTCYMMPLPVVLL